MSSGMAAAPLGGANLGTGNLVAGNLATGSLATGSLIGANAGSLSPMDQSAVLADVEALGARIAKVRAAIGQVIFGQDEVIDQMLITLLSGGHVLLVGVPGLGKSRLVETLGVVLGLATKRVQFTPDLMPADIVGSEVLDEAEGKRSFRFVPGPVFCQLLMADEINRASPRTQSALLQAMQEQRVAVGGVEHRLPRPFHVLATQNPIEQEGTYPLPEAQLDRFLLEVIVGYPDLAAERTMLLATTGVAEAPPAPGDDRGGAAGGAGTDSPRPGGREGGGGDPFAGPWRPSRHGAGRDGAAPRRLGSRPARGAGADAGEPGEGAVGGAAVAQHRRRGGAGSPGAAASDGAEFLGPSGRRGAGGGDRPAGRAPWLGRGQWTAAQSEIPSPLVRFAAQTHKGALVRFGSPNPQGGLGPLRSPNPQGEGESDGRRAPSATPAAPRRSAPACRPC